MEDLAVLTFLILAHLRESTCESLDSVEGVIAYATERGWLLHVPQNADGIAADGCPPELLPIIRLARERCCAYVLFDVDAPVTPLPPTFDW